MFGDGMRITEKYIEKIEKALWKKWEMAHGSFTLSMKSGNVITVEMHSTPAHRGADHRWHSGSSYFTVTGSNMETRYFKHMSGLAKAIAYGYIR